MYLGNYKRKVAERKKKIFSHRLTQTIKKKYFSLF